MRPVFPKHLTRTIATAGLFALGATVLVAAPASAAERGQPAQSCINGNAPDASLGRGLVQCVQRFGPVRHLEAFQAIADANGGNRAASTPGYDASVAYVVEQAEAAGLEVEVEEFDFDYFEINSEAFSQTAPTPTEYVAGTDFSTFTYSASGEVTGTAVPVDLTLPPAGPSTSGCEVEDFAGFPAGQIALLQRGSCNFSIKVQNAIDAGASAAIVFNSGVDENTQGVVLGTLGEPLPLPVVGASFEVGQSLQNATVTLAIDTLNEPRTTSNVYAETTRATGEGVLMVGAHLDSVPEGPGINDNGSGSAGVLTAAQLLANVPTTQTIRFAWWGAEELGLVGSDYYVGTLTEAEAAEITGYLNFDMIGSPNFARFIYDGDGSDFGTEGPEGSAEIEGVFEQFYDRLRLPHEGTAFDGRSDYGGFIAAGIPAGGLFTGAEGVKTPEQAALYGGTAGEAYDPNYHGEGDTIDNINRRVLFENTAAIVYSTLVLSR